MALRLSPTRLMAALQPWADVELPIQRRLVQLADAEPGREVLWVGCGTGRGVLWWCQRLGTHTEGVDPDGKAIEAAEAAARRADLSKLATFQVADPTNLPHEAQVFDTIVVRMPNLGNAPAQDVIREAGRVARPGGLVLGIVPSWAERPSEKDAQAVASVGLAPHLLVEWKSFFRDAGLVELHVEEAVPHGRWLAQRFVPLVLRGWHAGRWAGVRAVTSRVVGTVRQLAKQRALTLSIVKGTRWPRQ